jgi:hypothetical protein
VGAGFDSDIGGDVPDWDNTESRESDEDAAWRDLVARFDAPATTAEPTPWPERENVPSPAREPDHTAETDGADRVRRSDDSRGADGAEVSHEARGYGDLPGTDGVAEIRTRPVPDDSSAGTDGDRAAHEAADPPAPAAGIRDAGGIAADPPAPPAGIRGTGGVRGFDDEGVRSALEPDGRHGTLEPDVIRAARRRRRTEARSIRARQAAPATPADGDEHFVPPTPPPLPQLDSLAKGAWVALFGGPIYLVVATAAGWSVPGIAAFCAVAAFVTGFAILVLRMNEAGPGGPDDGDDGAVV